MWDQARGAVRLAKECVPHCHSLRRLRPGVLEHLERERADPAQPGSLPHEVDQHRLGVLAPLGVHLLGPTRRCGQVVSTRRCTGLFGHGRRGSAGRDGHGRRRSKRRCDRRGRWQRRRWRRRVRRLSGRRRAALQLLEQAEDLPRRRRARRLGRYSEIWGDMGRYSETPPPCSPPGWRA